MLFIALFILAVVGVLFARRRGGQSFHEGTARALAFLAGSLGLVLAVFLANHAAATARDDVHVLGDVAGLSLLVGAARWETRTRGGFV